MKIFRIAPLLFLLLDGCIDPLPLGSTYTEKNMVVDGMITDQPGPYTVKLFWSSPLSGDQEPEMITGASVSISDDEGGTFDLNESRPGFYKTDSAALRGQTGKAYMLRILTADGAEFQSAEEPLTPAGEIDSLYAVYAPNSINLTDLTLPHDAVRFFLYGKTNPLSSGSFARWRSTGIYEILTYPGLRMEAQGDFLVPAPLPCSEGVAPCTCCECWVSEYSRDAVVSPSLTAHEFHDVNVFSVPVNSWRFYRKYYFEVEQLSVSENVYEFWKRISIQQKGAGDLFQPNAIRVRGNIHCITDPDKEVFGVFSASAIIRKSMFVPRGVLPTSISSPDTVTGDCRFLFQNTVNMKPSFW